MEESVVWVQTTWQIFSLQPPSFFLLADNFCFGFLFLGTQTCYFPQVTLDKMGYIIQTKYSDMVFLKLYAIGLFQ